MYPTLDVVCAGPLFADCILTGLPRMPDLGEELYGQDYALSVGGGAGITAIGLARLGLRSGVVSQVGDDFLGDYLLARLREEGVDLTHVQRRPQSKTNLTVSLSFPQDRAFATYWERADALVELALTARRDWRTRHLHVIGAVGNSEVVAELKRDGLTVSCDASLRSPQLLDILRVVDVYMPSESEVLALTGAARVEEALAWLAQRVPLCVVKRGANGAMAARGNEMISAPGLAVEVVDTTGAGDAFNAGFLFGWLNGHDLRACLQLGNACGALSTTALGGSTALPTRTELARFLGARGVPLEETDEARLG